MHLSSPVASGYMIRTKRPDRKASVGVGHAFPRDGCVSVVSPHAWRCCLHTNATDEFTRSLPDLPWLFAYSAPGSAHSKLQLLWVLTLNGAFCKAGLGCRVFVLCPTHLAKHESHRSPNPQTDVKRCIPLIRHVGMRPTLYRYKRDPRAYSDLRIPRWKYSEQQPRSRNFSCS